MLKLLCLVFFSREYYLQQADARLAESEGMNAGGALGKISTQKHDLLTKLARTTPYYKRNRPHICSFWVKGECKRGEECPYRYAWLFVIFSTKF